jgi:hypothetical protein
LNGIDEDDDDDDDDDEGVVGDSTLSELSSWMFLAFDSSATGDEAVMTPKSNASTSTLGLC